MDNDFAKDVVTDSGRNLRSKSRNVRHRSEVTQRAALTDNSDHFFNAAIEARNNPAVAKFGSLHPAREF